MDKLILTVWSLTENLKETVGKWLTEYRKRFYRNRKGKMMRVKMNMNISMETEYFPMIGCEVNFMICTFVNDKIAASIRMIANDGFQNKDTLIRMSSYNPMHFAE